MIRRLITRLLPRFAREAVEWRQKCIDGEMVCISHGEFRLLDAASLETVYCGPNGLFEAQKGDGSIAGFGPVKITESTRKASQ